MNFSVNAALDMLRYATPRDRPTAATRIYDDLRQKILSLDIPPGTNLLRNWRANMTSARHPCAMRCSGWSRTIWC